MGSQVEVAEALVWKGAWLVGGEGLGRGNVKIEHGTLLKSWCRRCPSRRRGCGHCEVMRVVFIQWIGVSHS